MIKKYYSSYTGKQIDEAVRAIVENGVQLEDFSPELIETIKGWIVDTPTVDLSNYYTKNEVDSKFTTSGDVEEIINIIVSQSTGDENLTSLAALVNYTTENTSQIKERLDDVEKEVAAVKKYVDDEIQNIVGKDYVDKITLGIVLDDYVKKEDLEDSTITSVSDEFSLIENKLEIKEINVNKLIQTDGEELILNGGHA